MKKLLQAFRDWFLHDTRLRALDTQLLQGRMASWQVRSLETIDSLQSVEFKVTSQWGEDGIIDWLIERAGIPPAAHSFIEFGVENYREANTRFLLQNRNWRGLILDGSSAMVDAAKKDGLYWKYDLLAIPAFITRENINSLIAGSGMRGDIGLLSIDVDGNDYWIWEAIDAVRPILVICEYNAVFGDVYPIATPYDPAFNRTRSHFSNLYFGASIAALRLLAACKGYRFVGTTTAANDAFFVREDYARNFVDICLQNIVALPSRARESRAESGALSYVGRGDRLQMLAALPVVNVETGEIIRLGQLQAPYSQDWLERMNGPAA